MNAFLCILYELIEELVEHVLLVYVVRVGFHHHRGSSSGTKTAIVYMMVCVHTLTLDGVGLGKEMGLIDGGNALCEGSEGGNVRLGIERFALDGPRERVVARIWRVIQRVKIRRLVECEDDRGLV